MLYVLFSCIVQGMICLMLYRVYHAMCEELGDVPVFESKNKKVWNTAILVLGGVPVVGTLFFIWVVASVIHYTPSYLNVILFKHE